MIFGPRIVWSVVQRQPAAAALLGLLTLLLTPFVFFPEIMGDAGVTRASALRNGAALLFLILGAITLLLGLGTLARQRITRRNKNG